ncbi:thioredoxin domain-containing protein [Alteriqipengyuania lutimaris]|uniref:Protein-disulfide isomerase n=1 Tax=Alteriqipengyuania lutimaris TaxID=1538146 RepID=A0A395LGX8_9SPHN|nr:thioredoxin domain-containing protein [Alteriqipengyuania lutimaris]MBB3035487.1 protein-disulfide isomerase [Alteriqipengyuania lutimaris]RDS76052.1 protein-disulfide isomerase [Alteriqipengyuania lutimaris]
MKYLFAAIMVLVAGLSATPGLAQSAGASAGADGNWLARVERTPVSHLVGDPDAPVTLAEYISYTCPHCRDFAMRGEEILKLGYVRTGDLRFEYRHAAGNVVDLTASMLARCGTPDQFSANHAALMMAQPQFNALLRLASKAQTDRWNYGDPAARRRAVASDLHFYDIFERRGYRRPELDRCLADQALADRLEAAGQRDRDEVGVTGTPSFAINGRLLDGVHNWDALSVALADPDASGDGSPAGGAAD